MLENSLLVNVMRASEIHESDVKKWDYFRNFGIGKINKNYCLFTKIGFFIYILYFLHFYILFIFTYCYIILFTFTFIYIFLLQKFLTVLRNYSWNTSFFLPWYSSSILKMFFLQKKIFKHFNYRFIIRSSCRILYA